MVLALALLAAQDAAAAEYIESWSYDFPDDEELAGDGGWISGYEDDNWYGQVSDNTGYSYACPLTDDNGGSFGSRDAADNWFVNEDVDWNDALLTSNFYVTDDDAIGLVFRFQDRQNYYLFLLTNDASPVEGAGGMALIKVSSGEAEILDTIDRGYDQGVVGTLGISVNDNTITAWYSDEYSGPNAFDYADDVLSADDPDPFGPGLAGFYSYDVGYDGGRTLDAYIGEPFVYQVDDDEDGIIDDDDNCEFEANEDQADEDGDGIGDVCDDDFGTDPGDDTGDGGDDTGDGDGDVDISDIDGGDVKLGTGCSAVSGGGWLGLLVGLVALGGRRRS